MDWLLIGILCIAIVVVAVLRGLQALRHTRDTERGSLPGKGYHTIEANYFSGGGGGGHASSFKVPRDPQEYARTFIPKDKTK
ncbi:hypothetical protein [Sulfitobacter sabulilitoris]|uniref:Uncharacterized protein n=1 Tax=Sulfitobacter sabulilitoris TaxID=2562655 RepID=A0A5S3PPB4_9RHOB|nr:hypothetical protein [Sulfitobacter sabulilitoris]TMM54355.1 hypothetical protein FDT80_01815 [Sulfitobacter sabulilitoris]